MMDTVMSGRMRGFLAILILILVLFSVGIGYKIGEEGCQWNVTLSEAKVSVKGTGSMLPVIQPDNILDTIPFNVSNDPLCGHIYIYKVNWSNSTVVHRFLYETQNGTIYFKGDNNANYDPPATKEQILYEVKAIELMR